MQCLMEKDAENHWQALDWAQGILLKRERKECMSQSQSHHEWTHRNNYPGLVRPYRVWTESYRANMGSLHTCDSCIASTTFGTPSSGTGPVPNTLAGFGEFILILSCLSQSKYKGKTFILPQLYMLCWNLWEKKQKRNILGRKVGERKGGHEWGEASIGV